MKRLNAIIAHNVYQICYTKIVELEKDRIYCKHDMAHFLDVARITYIFALEDHSNIPREHIYAAALLHDIGRYEQYLKRIPHEKASANICVQILEDTGFNQEEILTIQEAILNHRNHMIKDYKNLNGYLYRGDKASRPCHSCLMEKQCDWSLEKKNLTIGY